MGCHVESYTCVNELNVNYSYFNDRLNLGLLKNVPWIYVRSEGLSTWVLSTNKLCYYYWYNIILNREYIPSGNLRVDTFVVISSYVVKN